MRTILHIIVFVFVLFSSITSYGQRGIGTNNADASAVLELKSTNKGFLLPRLTIAQLNAIVSPAEGLMVYCTDCAHKDIYFYNGNNWLSIRGPSNSVLSSTGKVWMDRNLGASQVATSYNDAASYGDLYQWGRAADGHHLRTSGTTTTTVTSAIPGHANFIRIIGLGTDSNWTDFGAEDNLWQGLYGINNPCPTGFRLPTEAEFDAERVAFGTNNRAGAFASSLKLSAGGGRDGFTGIISSVGSSGFYWSSTLSVGGDNPGKVLGFFSSIANIYTSERAAGRSVRCIKG